MQQKTNPFSVRRVPKLRSIGQLFPNLSVIRGNTLFTNYALISFENTDLQEVGLYSLTRITRGGVRISNNPKLCYADTIDWDLITEQDVRPEVLVSLVRKVRASIGKLSQVRMTFGSDKPRGKNVFVHCCSWYGSFEEFRADVRDPTLGIPIDISRETTKLNHH